MSGLRGIWPLWAAGCAGVFAYTVSHGHIVAACISGAALSVAIFCTAYVWNAGGWWR